MKTKRASGLFRLQNVLIWVVYGLAVLLIALLQMSPQGFPVIAYARPAPLIVLTVCVAMLEGPTVGTIVGVSSGLLWDLFSFRVFGYYGLLLMVLGLAVGLLVQWLFRANFHSAMVLCVSSVIVYTLLDWLVCYVLFLHEETVTVLLNVYLPNALYTTLMSPLMYWLVLVLARFLRRYRQK